MTFAARFALIAVLFVALAGCAHRRERAEAPPSAERAQRAEPATPPKRRRGRLSIPRFGIGRRAAPSEPIAVAPPPPPPRSAPPPPPAATQAPAPKPPVSEAATPQPPKPAPLPERADAKPVPATPGQFFAMAPEEARRRIVAYLQAKGYSMQQAADEIAADELITDPLLTDAKPIEHLADCGSSPLGKPILHSSVVEVHVDPEGTGSRVAITGLFVEIRQQRIGDGMSKAECRSRGVLEAEVLGALR